jgi:hypothetical protein
MACLSLGLLVALSGCSNALVGTWHTESVDPPESAKIFQLNKVTFNEDGTYTASATHEGKSRQSSGNYSFDGFKLKLETKDGTVRTYGATYNSFTDKLDMTTTHEGEKIHAVLAKETPEA